MPRRLVFAISLAALLAAVFAAGASGAARFYTPDYGGSDPEKMGAIELGPDGSLTPIPGSPFPAGIAGIGGLIGLSFAPEGSRATTGFLVSGGVQGYSVPGSGIFQYAGDVDPSASVTNTAISPDGRFAFAATREFKGVPREGVRRFILGADGSLNPLEPPAMLPDDVYGLAISPDGRFLFARQGNSVARFALGADGSLTPLGTTPAPGAFLLATSSDGRFLFVFGGSDTTVDVFAIGADGGLAHVGDTVNFGPTSARLFAVAPDDRTLYVAAYNDDAIRAVAIAGDGTPTALPGGLATEEPESVSVSPDGRHLVYYGGDGSTDVIRSASIGANGALTALPFSTPWPTGEAQPLVFQPQPAPVASFATVAAAPGQLSRFDATGSARAARFDWDFGDGTELKDGGPTPTHAYASPGAYRATLTVTDAAGCSARQVYNGQSTVCPGGAATTTAVTIDTLPALNGLKAQPKKFKPKPKGRAKGKFGTTFRYTLSEAADVRFQIERKRIGRLVGTKCKPATAKGKAKKKCPLFKPVGSRTQTAKAGAGKLKWNGILKGKPLPAGSYRATAIATDGAGGRSAAKTVGFRVLPLP
ncbi:MAG TPA: PKD domain-containing protein [Solirubrobacterales bacterium]|nr:PKD domain-containing protein [Solirubrobacterales bacterium]